ncbi:MAG: SMP-30/gluconolactonase/LRE family protein [Solirubrobacterales bacterium]
MRWHDGAVWFVDMHEGTVHRVVPGEEVETIARVHGFVSGIDWLADGTLLVVSMHDRRILRLVDGRLEVYADLLTIADYHLNDLVVRDDIAYVGDFGYDSFVGAPSRQSGILSVTPDGEARAATPKFDFPNGMAITPDGGTLIVAESWGDQISAFDRADDGSLSGYRLWAEMPTNCIPDGLALHADGTVWVAAPGDSAVYRVSGGEGPIEKLDFGERKPIACAFGGEDGNTLLVASSVALLPHECREARSASVEAITLNTD